MEFTSPFSRIEAILQNILGADNVLEDPLSRAEVILLAILNDTEITEELDYNELSELEALLYAIKESDEECTTIPETRSGKILLKILHGEKYEGETVSRVEELLKEWSHAAAWYTKTIGPSNPISVSDALAEPAVGLKVDLSPIQESSPWIDTVANTTPYLLRPTETTGNTADEKLVGGSVVWNQILRNGDFSDGTNNWVSEDARYTSLSAENNTLSVSVTQKPNQFYSIGMKQSIQYNVIANHKMLYSIDAKLPHASSLLIRGNVLGGSGQARIGKNLAENVWTKCQTIINANDTVQAYLYYAPVQSVIADYNVGDVIQYRNVMVTDLTQMFANNPAIADYAYSLEQAEAGSGIAWLKAQGFFNKIYYPYNPGEIMSMKAFSKKVVGFNLFDEILENGMYNTTTGEPENSISWVRSKNAFKVIPSTTYCVKTRADIIYVLWYDTNDNYLTYIKISNASATYKTTTSPNTAHFCRIYFWNSTSFKREICINLSDPNRNGQYEPYKEQTYTLGNDELRGLFKLDTTTNKLYTEGDVKTSDGVISRKYAEMTFDGSSDEEITLQSINDSGIANFNMITLPNYVGGVNKCITNRFDAQTTVIALTTTEGRFVNSNGIFFIRIKSSTVSTVEDFRTWLASNPITIIYELATPTTESSTPFTNPQDVYAGGTEEFVDSRDVPIPAGHETIYSNVQEIIGYDEVVITHGTDESDPNPTEYSISFQSMGTVYSGSLDVLRGVLTVDMAEVDLGTKIWTKATTIDDTFYISLSDMNDDITNLMCIKCSVYPTVERAYRYDKTISKGHYDAIKDRVYIQDSRYNNVDAATFKTAMSGVQLVYELATPLTYNLTQVEVEMLLNGNFLKSDGGVMTLTYKGTNPAILLMNKLRTNALMRKSKELQKGNLQPVLPKSKL